MEGLKIDFWACLCLLLLSCHNLNIGLVLGDNLGKESVNVYV